MFGIGEITFSTLPFDDIPLCIASDKLGRCAIVLVDIEMKYLDPFATTFSGSLADTGYITLKINNDDYRREKRISVVNAIVCAIVPSRSSYEFSKAVADKYQKLGKNAWLPTSW